MSQKKDARKEVSDFYAEAVKKGSCGCGCSSYDKPKGIAAASAGYDPAQLAELPIDASINSFGCGNPTALASLKEGETALDLGSGAGIDMLLAAKAVGKTGKVIGVDMTDEMIERARANAKAAGLDDIVEIRKGYIEELPVEDGSVDVVISNCVINLSPQKDRVFSEIYAVLKHGGRMSVSDIVAQDLPDWIRNNSALYSSCVAGAIGEDEYLKGLRDAGLVDVSVESRAFYDKEIIKGIIESELPRAKTSCCGGAALSEADADALAGELAGKIWSAKITARKP